MQLNRTMRRAGVTLCGVALGLLPAADLAGAHDAAASGSSLHGRVVSVGSGTFDLRNQSGTHTVDTTSSTAYSELGNASPLPGLADGEWVAVTLDPTAASPTASAVTVFPESVAGKVAYVSGSNVTLASRHGSQAVLVSSGTTYLEKGASPTGVSPGEFVAASGLPDPNNHLVLDAQRVVIANPPTPASIPGPPPPTPGVTPSTAPGAAFPHQPVPAAKPFEPAGGPAPHLQQPATPPTGHGAGPTTAARYNGAPAGHPGGAPGGQGWSHGGQPGTGFGGGRSGGGFGH